IVAVHGLGADPETTWVETDAKDIELFDADAAGGIAWLSHPKMLPAVVPGARIWTFNYDSGLLQGFLA
ncbi:hypothetical protein GP486_002353, partial [Trichoglossum hirsutum]